MLRLAHAAPFVWRTCRPITKARELRSTRSLILQADIQQNTRPSAASFHSAMQAPEKSHRERANHRHEGTDGASDRNDGDFGCAIGNRLDMWMAGTLPRYRMDDGDRFPDGGNEVVLVIRDREGSSAPGGLMVPYTVYGEPGSVVLARGEGVLLPCFDEGRDDGAGPLELVTVDLNAVPGWASTVTEEGRQAIRCWLRAEAAYLGRHTVSDPPSKRFPVRLTPNLPPPPPYRPHQGLHPVRGRPGIRGRSISQLMASLKIEPGESRLGKFSGMCG